MIIRKVTVQDVRNNELEIKELLKELLGLKFEQCENKINEVYENMKKFIEDGSAILIGAFTEENKIIGFIWAYLIKENTYHINYFAVDKNNRSLGIGQELLDELYKIARKNNINTIELLVEAHNDRAIKKYSSNDFKEQYIKMEKKL